MQRFKVGDRVFLEGTWIDNYYTIINVYPTNYGEFIYVIDDDSNSHLYQEELEFAEIVDSPLFKVLHE
jgi:hypothetical protein